MEYFFLLGCGEINEICDGTGTIHYSNGTYIGECKNGKKEGKGVFTWDSGNKYDGEWKNDKKEGKGVFTWDSGNKYDGEWKNGKKEGKGVYTWDSGDKYDGEWKNGKREGKGVFTWDSGNKYDGEWKNGKREGKGVYTWGAGDKYDGEWKNGKREGKGTTINQYGLCSGIWENNTLIEANQNSYEEGYEYYNKIRKIAGMIPLESNGILEDSAQNHSNYIQELEGLAYHEEEKNKSGYTGVNPYNRAIYAGYFSKYVGEGISHRCTAKISINSLMTAIYHRFGILTFDKNEVGIGFTQESNSINRKFVHNTGNSQLNELCQYNRYVGGRYYYDVCADKEHKISSEDYLNAKNNIKKLNPKYILWPVNNSINNLYKFKGEVPDPMPDYNQTGNPISIQFNDFYFSKKIKMKSFKLFKENNEIKEARILTEKTDPNKRFNNYQYALFPLKVLDKDTIYKVNFKYIYNGVTKEINWSFRTMK